MADPGGVATALGWWGVPLAVVAGAVRVSTPFLYVSLGECLTERSGRINLGLEGTLAMGAMTGYGVSYLTASPWLGVIAAGIVGSLLGAVHAGVDQLLRHPDLALARDGQAHRALVLGVTALRTQAVHGACAEVAGESPVFGTGLHLLS